jgi:hypothetical protein
MTNQNFLNSNYKNKLKTKIEVFDQSESVFFNTCLDKNQLKSLIAWFLEKYGEKITVDFLETLKQVGFHQATLAGVSLGVDDLQIPAQKSVLLSQALVKIGELTNAHNAGNITSVEKSQRLIDTWNQTSETLRQTAVQNFRVTNPVNPVFMMAFSGARGNISQVRQLVAMRGLMADPQGAILEFPIQSNFREGLTITEYLISCYGARKGLVDTALRTATSGYLTRRLVDAVQHVVVVMTDCKTKRGILITNKNLEQRLLGRVLLQDISLNSTTILQKNTLISKKLAKRLALKYKEIYVRSPLTCNTEKSVCQLCYGLNLAQGKLVSIGEAVGVIAAQSIGEPGTQLTMRTFHTGGVGVFSDQAMKSFNAPFDGKIQFLENLPGLFVRTPHGNIVYLLKYSENQTQKPILRVKSVNSTHEFYEILQCDVPAGSLLWVKQGEYVKTGQLLVQASQIKTSKQQMPESSHPVQAPYSGEVFFESMIIRVIRKQTQLKAKKLIKKEDEISPKFRTLTELGNFWIFSSGVQKESSLAKSFFVKGDLVSLDTPVFQYNLTIPKKGQLKRLKSCLVLGQNCFEFLISKTYYSKLLYFLIKSDSKNQNNIIVYNNNSKKALVTWYPALKNFNLRQSGYYFTLGNGTHLLSQKLVDLNVNDATGNYLSPLLDTQASFFWTETPIFTFTNFHDSLPFSCFLINNSSSLLSKKGIFQIEFKEKIKWSRKSRFSTKFLKNFSQILQIDGQTMASQKYIFGNSMLNISRFTKKSLPLSQNPIVSKNHTRLIQKKQTWFYIPEQQIKNFIPSNLTSVILEPGKNFENIIFVNSFVSVNFLQVENISFVKSKKNKNSNYNFYSISTLLNLTNFSTNQIFFNQTKFNKNKFNLVYFSRKFSNEFSFYGRNLNFKSLKFTNKIKHQLENLICFQKTFPQFIPDMKFFKQNWFFQQSIPVNFSTKSPLFTKQFTTFNKEHLLPQTCLKISTPAFSNWISAQNLIKIEITFKTPSYTDKNKFSDKNMFLSTSLPQHELSVPKFKSNFKISVKNSPSLFTGFSFLFYNVLKFQNSRQFSFETFSNGWVLPEFKITQAFLKSKKLGEFRHSQINQNSNSFSVLRNTDLVTFQLPLSKIQLKSLKMGTIVRWGQEIFPEFAIPISGQILKITSKRLTVRKGIPILASARGVVHVFNNDLILKNDLLITLKSRRLQTEDIVQGIPKIEQLFEARETQGGEIITNSAQTKLQSFFRTALQFKPLRVAVTQSIHQIQLYLVENILDAYSNQGVKISEKHVEIVVRQMTARVRILSGGDSGLLPGEIVQLKWVERVNNQLARVGSRQASYEPMILGITKSVLQSESFLVAASFQEVSRVLVRSALTKKTDFLRGLHENVILGQLIPAGTGVISRDSFDETHISSIQKSEIGFSDKNMFLKSE